MRVVMLSDTRRFQRQRSPHPEEDPFVHASDVGAESPGRLADLSDWFGYQSHQHKTYVAGNHKGHSSVSNP